jgi:hypothetical protein
MRGYGDSQLGGSTGAGVGAKPLRSLSHLGHVGYDPGVPDQPDFKVEAYGTVTPPPEPEPEPPDDEDEDEVD